MSFKPQDKMNRLTLYSPMYKRYKAKERKAILNSYPFGYLQRFELECAMDDNIDVAPIANIEMKNYTMSVYRELVYLGFNLESFKPLLDPKLSQSQVELLSNCVKAHIDIEPLINQEYSVVKKLMKRIKTS